MMTSSALGFSECIHGIRKCWVEGAVKTTVRGSEKHPPRLHGGTGETLLDKTIVGVGFTRVVISHCK